MKLNSNSKIIVIHHSADFDGLFCREIARYFLTKQVSKDNIIFIGWDYGEPKINIDSVSKNVDRVYVLDLNPGDTIEDPDYSNIIWIDHHKTAIDKEPKGAWGYRIDGVAACRLTWQWFSSVDGVLPCKQSYIDRDVEEPLAVRLVGEYDVWDKRDPNVDKFQLGLHVQDPIEYESLFDHKTLAEEYVEEIVASGEIIQEYQANVDKIVMKRGAKIIKFEGLTLLSCNSIFGNSIMFESGVEKHPEVDGAFKYAIYPNGTIGVSLYGVKGKPDIDLSSIAKLYGGGGHKQACGFILPQEKFEELFLLKK